MIDDIKYYHWDVSWYDDNNKSLQHNFEHVSETSEELDDIWSSYVDGDKVVDGITYKPCLTLCRVVFNEEVNQWDNWYAEVIDNELDRKLKGNGHFISVPDELYWQFECASELESDYGKSVQSGLPVIAIYAREYLESMKKSERTIAYIESLILSRCLPALFDGADKIYISQAKKIIISTIDNMDNSVKNKAMDTIDVLLSNLDMAISEAYERPDLFL